MSPKQGVDRRKFLVAGAGCAAAAGIGYLTKDLWYPLTQKTTAPEAASPTQTQTPTNSPPYANFELVRPKYILPCVGQEVQFENLSKDPDGDPLTHEWYVDDKLVGKSKDFAFRFTETGDPRVKLQVSDGKLKDEKEYSFLHVEPDQLYPAKPLNLKCKGTSYYVGPAGPEWSNPVPNEEEMNEQLDTIRDDLGCNAVIITGGESFEDRIIECGKLAIEKGFERIYVQPRYVNATVDKTVEKIGEFARRVRELRENSNAVGYCVGHEFQLETAIIRGHNFLERFQNSNRGIDLEKVKAVLPAMFRRIIAVCDKNYGYGITYAATPWEANESLVPWSDPAFESIGVNAYIHDFLGWDEAWFLGLFSRLSVNMKPIHSFDWGMMSFAGADKFGGWNPLNIGQNPYDEEPQARYCERTMKMLNSARIDGSFWVMYNDTFDRGHGLYNPQTKKRKKGFYMYKSYQ